MSAYAPGLDTVTCEQRRALELACFAGLTCTEIASQLGRTPAEIKTQLAAGMQTLRAHLQPQL